VEFNGNNLLRHR